MLKFKGLIFLAIVATTFGLSYDIHPAVIATCDIFNSSGVTCRDCDTLSRCVLMNNVWESYDVDKCDRDDGFFCNSYEQKCSQSAGPCNRLVEFSCFEEGYFPNPFTCQEYYSCIRTSQDTEILSYQRFCESGTAYNVATKTCTLKINDPSCLKLQWKCDHPGEFAIWPGTDDIFYLCVRNDLNDKIMPKLHKCTNNHIFDGINCVPRNEGSQTTTSPLTTTPDITTLDTTTPTTTGTISTTSSTTTPVTTTTTPVTTTTTPVTTTTTPVTTTTTPITTTTTPTTTTTTTPSTTTSATISTTSVTTTTTPQTTTPVTTTTPGPFVCSGPGLFPNPNNCRQYFYCDSLLKPTMYECPNGTYFVPETASCAWGDC